MQKENCNILVSVYMITYNHENYIKQAIESVINQKANFNYKLYIGEDCSTDKTRDIITEYARKHPDLIEPICHEKNVGPVANAQIVYKKCYDSGSKYIAMCEGDDFWSDPLKLQKQVDFLEKRESLAGCFHETYSLPNNEEEVDENTKIWRRTFYDKLSIENLLLSKYCFFHTSSFMFRSKYLNFPSWCYKIESGDLLLYYIIAVNGYLGKVKGVMSVYRQHDNGLSNGPDHNSRISESRIYLLKMFNKYLDNKYSDLIERTIKAFKEDQSVKLPMKWNIEHKILSLKSKLLA